MSEKTGSKHNEHELSPDSSAWARSLRQLFKNGKPTGNVIALTIAMDDSSRHPFGLLARTGNNRLIFWPCVPRNQNMVCEGMAVDLLDHVTLEFPSKEIHITAYDRNNQPIHFRSGWKTRDFKDYKLEMWLSILIKSSVIRQQDMEMFQNVRMPLSDKDRRINEFENYVKSLQVAEIILPPTANLKEQNYLHFVIYLGGDSTIDQLPNAVYPTGPNITDQVEGWDNSPFFIATTKIQVSDETIFVASAFPPGKLKPDVSVGFPI